MRLSHACSLITAITIVNATPVPRNLIDLGQLANSLRHEAMTASKTSEGVDDAIQQWAEDKLPMFRRKGDVHSPSGDTTGDGVRTFPDYGAPSYEGRVASPPAIHGLPSFFSLPPGFKSKRDLPPNGDAWGSYTKRVSQRYNRLKKFAHDPWGSFQEWQQDTTASLRHQLSPVSPVLDKPALTPGQVKEIEDGFRKGTESARKGAKILLHPFGLIGEEIGNAAKDVKDSAQIKSKLLMDLDPKGLREIQRFTSDAAADMRQHTCVKDVQSGRCLGDVQDPSNPNKNPKFKRSLSTLEMDL
ncbi:MAG: hypothetical protein M1816_007832 [Peltula sp. TS41687]|nr:MAG: hypothetical protein M1816_007832 [Peltula sp. TS41687]